MSYDILLKTPRGSLVSPIERKQLRDDFDRETNLNGPCEITDLDSDPDAFDLTTLDDCINEGEFTRREYESFCEAHGLVPGTNAENSYRAARTFLDVQWGQSLLTLKLPRPDGEVREAYRLIVEFARRHKLVVNDPQKGQDIDLEKPGEIPPMWR
jgi:hypothetical protein